MSSSLERGRPDPRSRPCLTEGARQRFLSERYFSAFDGLRCIAICGVIWHHSLPGPALGWLGRGHAGVPLFFALSGFLITSLLLRERRDTGGISLGAFWMRRALRIFPLYYAVLAGFVLHVALTTTLPTDASRHFWRSLPYYASYTGNWFVNYDVSHPVWFGFAWSLATEEQFYLLWPPLLRRSLRSGTRLALAALSAAVLLDQLAECRTLYPWLSAGGIVEWMLMSLSSPMLLGAGLAILLTKPGAFGPIWSVLGRRWSLHVSLLSCALLLVWPWGPPLLFDVSLACVVTASALSPQTVLLRWLSCRPLAHIGRVSYCVYLIHIPVIGSLKLWIPWLANQPSLLFPIVLAVSTALGTWSYRYFEAPFTRLRARYRHEQGPAPRDRAVTPLPSPAPPATQLYARDT